MTTMLRGRHWITTSEWSKEELETVLACSADLKRMFAMGMPHRVLQDKTLFMIFFEKSTRTRNSTEAAMTQLGGHAHDLTVDKLQIAHGETAKDTACVLSRYGHGIAIRNCFYGIGNKYIREVASFSTIPVINLQCDVDHPCQTIADIMTIREKFGMNLRGLKFVISWTYAPAYARPMSVPQGLIALMPRFGLDVTLAYPREFYLMPQSIQEAKRFAEQNGVKFNIVHDMDEAFRGADILYPKSWGCMQYLADQKIPEEDWNRVGKEIIGKYKNWICDEKRVSLASKDRVYMHPLPADRGYEVTDAVIDSHYSIVYDQAENRLHTVKALLALTMGGRP